MYDDQSKTSDPAVGSTRLVRQDIFGWFDSPDQTVPAHDPGLKTICPVCAKELSRPMKTISMMTVDTGSDRSYFFRVHKLCWEGITERERDAIEGSLVDALTAPSGGDNCEAGSPSPRRILPNDVRERWGPAATDARIASDLNGWSPSAPRIC